MVLCACILFQTLVDKIGSVYHFMRSRWKQIISTCAGYTQVEINAWPNYISVISLNHTHLYNKNFLHSLCRRICGTSWFDRFKFMQASTYCSQSITIWSYLYKLPTQKENAIMAHESYLLNARAYVYMYYRMGTARDVYALQRPTHSKCDTQVGRK